MAGQLDGLRSPSAASVDRDRKRFGRQVAAHRGGVAAGGQRPHGHRRRGVPVIRARGAALLLVLWLITLLTGLIGTFALTARMEGLQGRMASEGVVAEQAARAGLEYALIRVNDMDARRRWQPD